MLAKLLNNPFQDERAMSEWSFHHRNDHLQILQAIQNKYGVQLTDYDIYPMNKKDMESWLIRHQSLHNAMNGVLGYTGEDLNRVDFNDEDQKQNWISENFNEHYSAHQLLGI